MFYAWDITIPANTQATTPLERVLKITKGVVVRFGVKFPSGHHSLVKVRLFYLDSQLFPLSRGEWITGDDEAIDVPEYFEIKGAPYTLKFHGCSPGTTYPHLVTVRVVILPKEVASFVPLIELLTKILQRIFGAV